MNASPTFVSHSLSFPQALYKDKAFAVFLQTTLKTLSELCEQHGALSAPTFHLLVPLFECAIYNSNSEKLRMGFGSSLKVLSVMAAGMCLVLTFCFDV